MKSFRLEKVSIALVLASLLLLSACSGEQRFADLEDFMAKARAKPAGKIEPIPSLQIYEVFKYTAMTLRSPFDPPATVVARKTTGKSTVKPDENRVKEVLEYKSFSSLSMVGALQRSGTRFALISDGAEIHRVSLGSYLGKNNGKIVAVDEYQTDVIEIIPDGEGGWVERPRSLPLKENK